MALIMQLSMHSLNTSCVLGKGKTRYVRRDDPLKELTAKSAKQARKKILTATKPVQPQ